MAEERLDASSRMSIARLVFFIAPVIIDCGAHDAQDRGIFAIERVDHGRALGCLSLAFFEAGERETQPHFLHRVGHQARSVFQATPAVLSEIHPRARCFRLARGLRARWSAKWRSSRKRFQVVAAILIAQQSDAQLEHARRRIAVGNQVLRELFDLRAQARAGGRAAANAAQNSIPAARWRPSRIPEWRGRNCADSRGWRRLHTRTANPVSNVSGLLRSIAARLRSDSNPRKPSPLPDIRPAFAGSISGMRSHAARALSKRSRSASISPMAVKVW